MHFIIEASMPAGFAIVNRDWSMAAPATPPAEIRPGVFSCRAGHEVSLRRH